MSEAPLTGTESLEIIQTMIRKAKNQFSENGHSYLVWGWVIFICCVGQYVLINIVHTEKHYMIWFLTWAAAAYQIIYHRIKRARKKVRTYTDEIVAYVWLAYAAGLVLAGFSLSYNAQSSEALYFKMMGPVFLALYGIPTFLCGIILQFKPLVWGGCFCWILSLSACFIPAEYQLLLLAAAVVFAWIIPGYLLQANYKKQNN